MPGPDPTWNWPGIIFGAGIWLIVLGALVAALVAWAVVVVAGWVRRGGSSNERCSAEDRMPRE
jgi:hypothetical protein